MFRVSPLLSSRRSPPSSITVRPKHSNNSVRKQQLLHHISKMVCTSSQTKLRKLSLNFRKILHRVGRLLGCPFRYLFCERTIPVTIPPSEEFRNRESTYGPPQVIPNRNIDNLRLGMVLKDRFGSQFFLVVSSPNRS